MTIRWMAMLAGAWMAWAPSVARGEEPVPAPKVEETLPADVVEVLDKMDAAGKTLKTVRAQFDYELNQTLYDDTQKRKGNLVYQAPNLLRFEFTDRPQETFVFDGRTLFHKKDATRQLIIWELRLPDEPPVDSFELGKVPFPLPFGQKKETVLKHFTVTRDAKEEAADKAKRAVLALVPKKDSDLARDYRCIRLWVDAKQNLPTRARLEDTSENITTVDFHHVETNKDADEKQFGRPKVPDNWEIMTHAKEPAAAPEKKP
ncbi:MAG TPA: outer membrane lipoprotein carrier protein LolA [Phycisphaerae bacterium]|nr:outer membrane lipoprotein carrier protein LolA [Phycisphaerae bacterium]